MKIKRQKIAVIGSGISGLSCAWLLAKAHDVKLFESNARFGGHAHTENFNGTFVDVGFIVFNELTYPNLTALFRHLNITTIETEMGFSVSLDQGRFEYSGGGLAQLLGSPRNAISRSHWVMLSDLARFYRTAKTLSSELSDNVSLGEFLRQQNFGDAFIQRHLIPMAAAIWSSHPKLMLAYPARAFIDFFDNHQLLNLGTRQKWRTVSGGSMVYVRRMIAHGIELHGGDAVIQVSRDAQAVRVHCQSGHSEAFEQVVFATHADQTLRILERPTDEELTLLGPFNYSDNRVVVHHDETLMPKRKRHWSSWNYVGNAANGESGVTYWMNSLQKLATKRQIFVTLNPAIEPKPDLVELDFGCTHPIFSTDTLKAQKQLWQLQGKNNTWFCGAYFGAGFHEDGLQAGLAVAEKLGGTQRPWHVGNHSGRIYLDHNANHRIVAQ